MNMETTYDKSRQVMEETGSDREGREAGGFSQAEKDLPHHIGSRSNIPFMDNITSFLGWHNPFAKDVDSSTECVWLLDNHAYRPVHVYPHAPQPFQAEFVAAYFKKNTGKDVSKIVANIADQIGLGNGDGLNRADSEKIIAQRLQPFVDTIAPARSVDVKLPDGSVHKLGPSGRSAVSEQLIMAIQEHKDGESATISAVSDCTPYGDMLTQFAEPEGWLFVSDIDDSIKITMTPSPIGTLRSTFVSEPTPIAGMPELYAQVAQTLNPTWFYLSASPYNLYPFLRKFLHQYYTPGTIILRDASWMDLGGFLASLTQGTEAYKRSRIEKIHTWFPKRKVLCLGDSTQSDPEAYGDICRIYPGWVKAVFIRKVTDVSEMKDTDKNTDERFEKAFKGVDKSIWRTFEDPKELYGAIEQLKGV
ncbi:hypothetical protein P7C71_g5876, partial [Lecanoromycetidae sp. Uapishka_2]